MEKEQITAGTFPPAKDAENNPNLFVNYLPPTVDDTALLQLFSPYGRVESCKVMMDLYTGQSRCYGFVKFATVAEAEQASQALNGYQLENKRLVVKPANTSSGDSEESEPSNNVYVKGFPLTMTEDQLRDLFSMYGVINDVKILVDPSTHISKGIGFVRYSSVEDASNAIEQLNGQKVIAGCAKPLTVKFADSDEKRKERKLKQGERRAYQQSVYATAAAASRYNPYAMPYVYQGANPSAAPPMIPLSGGGFGMSTPQNERCLFVANIPSDADDTFMYKLFSPYGGIESVRVIRDRETGVGKGYGFVSMMTATDAWTAMQSLNGYQIGEKVLQVSYKKHKTGGAPSAGGRGQASQYPPQMMMMPR